MGRWKGVRCSLQMVWSLMRMMRRRREGGKVLGEGDGILIAQCTLLSSFFFLRMKHIKKHFHGRCITLVKEQDGKAFKASYVDSMHFITGPPPSLGCGDRLP